MNYRRTNLLLISIIILGLFLRLSQNPFGTWLDLDESFNLYVGELAFQGDVLYKDIRTILQNPGIYFLEAVMHITQPHQIIFSRMVTILVSVLNILLIYLLGKEVFNEHVGIISSCLLAVQPLSVVQSNFFLIDIYLSFFINLSILFFIKFVKYENEKTLILSAFFGTVSFIFKQPGILVLFLILVYLFLKKELRRFSTVFIVLLLTLSPMFLYLVSNGAFSNYVDDTVLFSFKISSFYKQPILSRVQSIWNMATPLVLVFSVLGFSLVLSRPGERAMLVFGAISSVYLIFYLFVVYAVYTYKLIVVIPILVVLASVSFEFFLRKNRNIGLTTKTILVLVVLCLLGLTLFSKTSFLPNRIAVSGGDQITQNSIKEFVSEGYPTQKIFAFNPSWYLLLDNPVFFKEYTHTPEHYLLAENFSQVLYSEIMQPSGPDLVVIEEDNLFILNYTYLEKPFFETISEKYEIIRRFQGQSEHGSYSTIILVSREIQ